MKAEIKPRINLDDRTPLQNVIPLSTPFIIFIDPSSTCNFECKFCPTGDRQLIRSTNRYQGPLDFGLYCKMIDELSLFQDRIKVLRLYKDGEPFLNSHLVDMVAYAKKSGNVPYIDTTTNGTLLDPERMQALILAGLDKINISVDGMNDEQYRKFTGFDFNFSKFVENVRWLYANKGECEIVIKIPGELISEEQKNEFFDAFGNYCDRIFIENFAPCWPEFDVEKRLGITFEKGIYQQPVTHTDTCPYLFYSLSINSDGTASACFLDWARRLIVGDTKKQTLPEIWHSSKLNALRMDNLEGKRMQHPVCSRCGQLTHCLPDNIDAFREELIPKMRHHMAEIV
jgi:radical SAM protein with 4Fe4S-binding SPASM domain